MLLLWLCWIDIPGIDSGMLNSDPFWVSPGCLSTRGGSPLYQRSECQPCFTGNTKGVCYLAILEISALLLQKPQETWGQESERWFSWIGWPCLFRHSETRGNWEKRSESFSRKQWRTRRCREWGRWDTANKQGTWDTENNLRGGDQSGREGNASHTPHHLGLPSHSRPSNIC